VVHAPRTGPSEAREEAAAPWRQRPGQTVAADARSARGEGGGGAARQEKQTDKAVER